MKTPLLILLAIFLFLCLIIFLPINLKAKVSYNILKNKGNVLVKLFKLTIIDSTLTLQDGFVELKFKKSGKTILSPITASSYSSMGQTDVIMLILKKIKLEQGTIYINFGAKDDAFLTAMVVGLNKALTSILGCIVVAKKRKSKIKNKIYPVFSKDRLYLNLKASIKISIFGVLQSLIQSKTNKSKNNKEIMQNG